MFALIHQASLNAMQSGQAGHDQWCIEFPSTGKKNIDPLTGSTGSSDMLQELTLKFDDLEAAIAYAKSKNIPYQVKHRIKHVIKGRSYGDNFSYGRKFPWTH